MAEISGRNTAGASPAYGVYISQLIRYGRACSNYEDFIARGQLLTTRLQHQGYTTPRLKSTFRKFFGRQHDIVGLYEKSASGASWNIKDERRIVLVGKTGCGKSSTGNTILGEECFESDCSAASVTTVSNGKSSKRFGRHLLVVDTPGLFDTTIPKEEILQQISQCTGLASPGPHAFILVIAANRFTEENIESLKLLEELFGENMYQHLIVLFTRVDDMKKGYNDFIQNKLTNNLRILIQRCNKRHIGFNNNNSASNQQDVEKLLDMIEGIVSQNNGQWYSNEVFKKGEDIIQEDKAFVEKKIIKEERMLIRALEHKSSEVQATRQNQEVVGDQDIQNAPGNIVRDRSSKFNMEEIREIFRSFKESTERPKSQSDTKPTILDNLEQETREIKLQVLGETNQDVKPKWDLLIRDVKDIVKKYKNDENSIRQYLRDQSVNKKEGFSQKMMPFLKNKFQG